MSSEKIANEHATSDLVHRTILYDVDLRNTGAISVPSTSEHIVELSTLKAKPKIKVIITDDRLKQYGLPEFATEGSAGIDLRAFLEDNVSAQVVFPGEVLSVSTGLRIWVENPNYAAFALPRSGLGTKGLVLANLVGLIDSDYQGPLTLKLWNRSNEPIVVNSGDRVAQLVVMPVIQYELEYVSDFEKSTIRGQGGFG